MRDIFELEEELVALFEKELEGAFSGRTTAEVIYLAEILDNVLGQKVSKHTKAEELY